MPKKTKTAAKKTTKKAIRKSKYVCYDCGTEIIMDCCGVGFRRLICCGKTMKKKRK